MIMASLAECLDPIHPVLLKQYKSIMLSYSLRFQAWNYHHHVLAFSDKVVVEHGV